MDYQETIDFLFSKLPMFSRIGPAAFKKDLTNIEKLCASLENPQNRFKSIHIAGTNGKGSVSHMLAAVLQTAGYKTGLYTSPHLKDFRERIKINGEMIGEEQVTRFTEKIRPLIEELEPSFFEITVAMAFDHFAGQQVDIAVIEVGLGGRFDSTNIITPELSVITNIGLDHVNMLGDSLGKIAFEKAGIIKQGIPVVIGESLPETKPVFEAKAKEMNACISFAQEKRQVTDWKWEHHQLVVETAEQHHTDHRVYRLDLPGLYQTKNLLTVLEAARLLLEKGWRTGHQVLEEALPRVKLLTGLHGRWEQVHRHPDIILEVAHNEDGMRQMTEQLELSTYRHLHIILGIVKDKDPGKVLALLPKQASYYFTQAHIPRALEAKDLEQQAKQFGLNGEISEHVNSALDTALERADKQDLILVCGSIFLVAEIADQYLR